MKPIREILLNSMYCGFDTQAAKEDYRREILRSRGFEGMMLDIFMDDIFWNGLDGVDENIPELEGEIGATMSEFIPYERPLRNSGSRPI